MECYPENDDRDLRFSSHTASANLHCSSNLLRLKKVAKTKTSLEWRSRSRGFHFDRTDANCNVQVGPMRHTRQHHVGCKHLGPEPGEDNFTLASGRQERDESAVGQSPRL